MVLDLNPLENDLFFADS